VVGQGQRFAQQQVQRVHAERQNFRGNAGGLDPDFNDYRVSLSKTFGDEWLSSLQVTENSDTALFNGTRSNLNESETRYRQAPRCPLADQDVLNRGARRAPAGPL
jgi:hypothetical protein